MGVLTSLNWPARAKWVAVLAALAARPALAQDLSPITNMLTTIGETLTGPLGLAAALIGVVVVGLMLLSGRMQWGPAIAIFVGIAVIIGAGTILDGFAA